MPFGTNMSPVETYQKDICTVTANITGLPALSAPCGYDGANLPIGMQLIGKPFCEADILNAFYLFEKETDGAFLTNLEMGYRL
jgi:aspartyl-tRNA(Asn)/glutamyl-tRNA(Gln) amidotransferase subunit A